MARKAWKFVAAAMMAVGAIASAAPTTGEPAAAEQRPASPDLICDDPQVGRTFGGDHAGCRQYLDACLEELVPAQRIEWRRSVEKCISEPENLYRCYAEVPWC